MQILAERHRGKEYIFILYARMEDGKKSIWKGSCFGHEQNRKSGVASNFSNLIERGFR